MDGGLIESITYARRPEGESHKAYAVVCGLSPTACEAPGVIGGVMPGVVCIGSGTAP